MPVVHFSTPFWKSLRFWSCHVGEPDILLFLPRNMLRHSCSRDLGTRQRWTYFHGYLGTGNRNTNRDQTLDLGRTGVKVISLKAQGAGEFFTASQTPVRPCA